MLLIIPVIIGLLLTSGGGLAVWYYGLSQEGKKIANQKSYNVLRNRIKLKYGFLIPEFDELVSPEKNLEKALDTTTKAGVPKPEFNKLLNEGYQQTQQTHKNGQ